MVSRKWILIFAGFSLIAVSLIIFGLIYRPMFFPPSQPDLLINQEFKIVIPKINIESKVIANIDPYNKEEYLEALSKGVALAKGTAFPGEGKNIFIFAHSTDSPLNITKYNAAFFSLNKLQAGDEIFLSYQGKQYRYAVLETQIVNPDAIEYLNQQTEDETLTLMTCWPPGTTLKRLLIQGKLYKILTPS